MTAPADADAFLARLGEGRRLAAALLYEVEGSAPFRSGAMMLIDDAGGIEGSITGGCVEGAVAQEAARVLSRGGTGRLLTYGVSDELAGTVGLTCGGTVHVLLHELTTDDAAVERSALEAVAAGRPAAIATLLDGSEAGARLALIDDDPIGSLRCGEALDMTVTRDARGLLEQGLTGVRSYGSDGTTLASELRVSIRCFASSPRMVIFGAVDFAAALAQLADQLGYAVTISDPRERFLRSPRYSRHAEAVVGWPREALEKGLGPRDAVVVFSHDPKIDEPAIREALRTDAGYVGALGSRKTTEDRERRLREAGCDAEDLARIHAPAGLDIGSSTAGEVAVSVMAEIVAVRAGRSGRPLRETKGKIQPRTVDKTISRTIL